MKTKMLLFVVAALFTVAVCSKSEDSKRQIGSRVNLSPPWFTLQKKFKYTFGEDPAVHVGDLDTSREPVMFIPIVVDDKMKGESLRTLIRPSFPMGNIKVITNVTDSKRNPWKAINITTNKQLQDVVEAAFKGNPLFVKAEIKEIAPNYTPVGLIMTKTVVQFFNDDLSDFYSNFNGVTAQVMSDLILQDFKNGMLHILTGTQE
ncbi:uncharacterized protein [Montipora capricornis]|uniref:uncharacterized protein n=1 Tax=Montipora capricornis TaxID=246305 RepID=UPI0035F20B23